MKTGKNPEKGPKVPAKPMPRAISYDKNPRPLVGVPTARR